MLGRLKDIRIDDIFGVAGDFAFPIQDAIVQYPGINWLGCCNELNAGYAADGYARIRGAGALSTTYGVGELSAISAMGGAYAENIPVFHLTGMPTTAAQHKRELVHHTLGNGEFDFFAKMAGPVVCAKAIITPQNAVYETERLIAQAFYHRRPAAETAREPRHALREVTRSRGDPRAAAQASHPRVAFQPSVASARAQSKGPGPHSVRR